MGGHPKIGVFYPPQIIHLFIGFSELFSLKSILEVFPVFLVHPNGHFGEIAQNLELNFPMDMEPGEGIYRSQRTVPSWEIP